VMRLLRKFDLVERGEIELAVNGHDSCMVMAKRWEGVERKHLFLQNQCLSWAMINTIRSCLNCKD